MPAMVWRWRENFYAFSTFRTFEQAQAEAEANRRADEAAKKAAEFESKRKAEAEAKRAEDEFLRALRAEKERQRIAEAEAKRMVEAEAKQKAEEAKRAADALLMSLQAERERQRAIEAEAKRKAEADAKQKAEEAKREAASLKEEERQRQLAKQKQEEDRRLAEKARKDEEARQVAESKREVNAKQKADTDFDKQLRAIMNNPKESLTQRKIAAIALGVDPSSLESGSTSTIAKLKTGEVNKAEREIANRERALFAFGGRASTSKREHDGEAAMTNMRLIRIDVADRLEALAKGSGPANDYARRIDELTAEMKRGPKNARVRNLATQH